MSIQNKNILITAATGRQSSSVVKALISSPNYESSKISIYALTRNPNSPQSQKLKALHPTVSLIQGSLDSPSEIFSDLAHQEVEIWGVFSVQFATHMKMNDIETKQGKDLIDESINNGVKHFVYSSGDRGGEIKSERNPTSVPNLIAKHNIEQHLFSKGKALTWTVLRPVTFMENHVSGLHGAGFMRLWSRIGPNKPLQVISTSDIGFYASQSFLHPNSLDYRNRCISLVGDELTFEEARKVYKEVFGQEVKVSPRLIGSALVTFKKEEIGSMFEWLTKEGYGADLEECRRLRKDGRGELLTYKKWLAEKSDFVKK